MNVAWWCSAQTGPWSWAPQAYPGIWLFMALLLGAWLWAVRRAGPRRVAPDEPPVTRARAGWFLLGWALLWATLDWPLGTLAAGYLLTAHMLQYAVIVFLVGPLLESGIPVWMRRAALAPRALAPLRRLVRRPFAAFMLLNVVLVGTHVPAVTDALKPLQFGSMAIDLLWVGSALLFWLATSPEPAGAARGTDALYGRRFLYVVGVKVLPIFLGAFFVLADFPLYRTYELAPRAVEGLTAHGDQVLAGWLMWVGTTPLVLYRLGAAFFAWYQLEARRAGEV